MNNLENLKNALVIAVVNPNYYGRKVFTMFHIKEQTGDTLVVDTLWDMDYPDNSRGQINPVRNSVNQLKIEDIWVFVTSVSETQKAYLEKLGIEYRYHKDDKALERLAHKLDMDLMNIGYEGEPDEGTWFTCCRLDSDVRNIIPSDMYVYSLRASDIDDSQPCMIDEFVWVNHYGDILTDRSLPVSMKLEVAPVLYDEEDNIIGS